MINLFTCVDPSGVPVSSQVQVGNPMPCEIESSGPTCHPERDVLHQRRQALLNGWLFVIAMANCGLCFFLLNSRAIYLAATTSFALSAFVLFRLRRAPGPVPHFSRVVMLTTSALCVCAAGLRWSNHF